MHSIDDSYVMNNDRTRCPILHYLTISLKERHHKGKRYIPAQSPNAKYSK